ncbi:hypothetical protein [uncultured Methanospirillum sp.]|uniref:hypothetical protein n=1 Tax=uncultured Methanospirillum sp. TaxID=262503 RepID=UPI0029C60B00|nr:hypothetical protein [uncultured Methanospirillum sp.]
MVLSISICYANEETTTSLLTVSGNTSLISSGDNGNFQIRVENVNPNVTITQTNQTVTGLLKKVIPADPCIAALIFSGINENETVFLVQVSNPEYSSDNETLSWNVTPQKFYDGVILTEYAKNITEFKPGSYPMTHVYLESPLRKVQNGCETLPNGEVYCTFD